jgi:hypothetical protein
MGQVAGLVRRTGPTDNLEAILTFGVRPDHVVLHEVVRNRSQSAAATHERSRPNRVHFAVAFVAVSRITSCPADLRPHAGRADRLRDLAGLAETLRRQHRRARAALANPAAGNGVRPVSPASSAVTFTARRASWE